jgi:hypothetical protein
MKSLVSLLVFILSWNLQDLQAQDLNRLANGSFDNVQSNGIASEWRDNSGWADVKVKYSAEIERAHSKQSQKIECIDFKSGAVQFVQSGLRVSKGQKYAVSIWMKGDIDSPVQILSRKHGAPYTTYFSRSFKVDDIWREYKFTAIAAADDPDAFFMVRFTSTGTLWLDDVAITAAGAGRSTALPLVGNLIANGSFEVGLDRWGVNIREAGGYEYAMPVDLHKQQPVVDVRNAKIGRSSLKIIIPKNGRALLTSPFVIVNPGRNYSLSLWSASDKNRSIRIGLGTGSSGQHASLAKTVQVGRVWKKYTFSTVLPPAPDDAYHVFVESEGDGNIWIDGVQLEEGDATQYASHSLAEIGLKRDGISTLYEVGKDVSLAAVVSSEKGGSFHASIKSVSYEGTISTLWKGDVVLAPNERREIKFECPAGHPGYYKLIAEVGKAGQLLDSSEMAVGFVAKRVTDSTLDSPFGGHARFNLESFNNMKMLGVGWLRMHPPQGTKWFLVEKDKGKFVFYDEPILLAKSMGLNILGSLDTTPRWASTAPLDQSGQGVDGYRSYAPRDLADWENYVYQTVLHYKGIIDHWEVWNEPDSGGFLKVAGLLGQYRKPAAYAELLRTAYIAAKLANPNAVIVGGVGTGQPPTTWVEEIFKHGAYKYMDVLSFHFYTDGRPGDALDIPTGVFVSQLKFLMQNYGNGKEKPIWESESGIMNPATSYKNSLEVTSGYAMSADDSVAYLIRNYVYLLASGVSKWFYYSMFTSHRTDMNDATGFFEWDGSPRPMAVAYANLAGLIGNAKYNRTLEFGKDILGEEFTNADGVVDILWTRGWNNKRVTLTLPVPHPYVSAIVYDAMGNVIGRTAAGREINLIVTKSPLYVVLLK